MRCCVLAALSSPVAMQEDQIDPNNASVRELKQWLRIRGVTDSSKKGDLVDRVRKLQRTQAESGEPSDKRPKIAITDMFHVAAGGVAKDLAASRHSAAVGAVATDVDDVSQPRLSDDGDWILASQPRLDEDSPGQPPSAEGNDYPLEQESAQAMDLAQHGVAAAPPPPEAAPPPVVAVETLHRPVVAIARHPRRCPDSRDQPGGTGGSRSRPRARWGSRAVPFTRARGLTRSVPPSRQWPPTCKCALH